MPGGFDDPSHHPLFGQNRKPDPQSFGGSLVDQDRLEQGGAAAVDHPGGHGPVRQALLEVEELLETHPLEVSLAVTVELFAQERRSRFRSRLFSSSSPTRKRYRFQASCRPLSEMLIGIFDGGRRLQDHLPQEPGFGQPGRAVGENGQGDDQQNRRHDEGVVFSGDQHAFSQSSHHRRNVQPLYLKCHLFEDIQLIQGDAGAPGHGGEGVIRDRDGETRLLPDQQVDVLGAGRRRRSGRSPGRQCPRPVREAHSPGRP